MRLLLSLLSFLSFIVKEWLMRPGIADGFRDQGRLVPDHLIAGEFPRVCRFVLVNAEAALPAGAVLGEVSAGGVYHLSDASRDDGAEVPVAILAEPIEVSDTPVSARVYLSGEFHLDQLLMGPDHTEQTITAAFRTRSIFLRGRASA